MATPKRKTQPNPKPSATVGPTERAKFARVLRDEARGLPYDPNDDSLAILASALADTSVRH
jgi:hypothetical protein